MAKVFGPKKGEKPHGFQNFHLFFHHAAKNGKTWAAGGAGGAKGMGKAWKMRLIVGNNVMASESAPVA